MKTNKRTRTLLTMALAAGIGMTLHAESITICDFENYEIGQQVSLWNYYNSPITTATATVVADPDDASNKVLHLQVKAWNVYADLPLPEELVSGIAQKYSSLKLRLRRASSDEGDYKHFAIFQGAELLYEDDGWPHQGNKGVWLNREYGLTNSSNVNSDRLRLGFNSDNVDYYLDDIALVKPFEINDEELADTHSLRYYAEACGKEIGVAVPAWRYNMNDDNLAILQTVSNDFNMIVAENCMKFDAIQPQRGTFNFTKPDQLVAFAQRNNMEVRGHTLVWHSQIAQWVSSDGKQNDKNWTREQLLEIMETHIRTVMTRYKGKIREWDVVNECLSDNQTTINYQSSAYDMRTESVWQKVIGEDFVDSAFIYAHRVDPDAILYLNDYGVEFKGRSKTEALYNLAKRLKQNGIPIHGVGIQCHLDAGNIDASKIAANIKRYADIGLKCIITELDIAINGTKNSAAYQQQATDYRNICQAMLDNDNCPTMMIWGTTDDLSWRQPNEPLLYDENGGRKQAWYAVRAALREEASKHTDALAPTLSNTTSIIEQTYYTTSGVRLKQPLLHTPIIVRTRFADGTIETKLRIIR